MINFKLKVIYIYITKFLGILTGFLSVILVVPKLTSNPTTYAIYTLCISLGLFFSYADLGFLSAGQKFATESFIQNKREDEVKVISFVLFVFSIFVASIFVVLILFSIYPEWIIKTTGIDNLNKASILILILGLSSPVIILQKFNLLVCSVRIEEYIFQIIELIFNLFKIVSIQFFVTSSNYNIVGYYFTNQLLTLFSAIICFVIVKRRYKFQLKFLLINFKFSRIMYDRTKGLALSSLLLTFSWILYFELDSIILSKFFGIEILAIYSVAFVLLNFCRNLYNALFSPFNSLFYQLAGKNEDINLRHAFFDLMKWSMPLSIIPPFALIYYMDEIISIWVGVAFLDSIFISRVFVLTISLTALYIPMGYIIMAKAMNNLLRTNAIILPLIFYGSMAFLYYIGLKTESLAISKLFTILINLLLYFIFMYRYFGISILQLYLGILLKMIFPLTVFFLLVKLMPDLTLFKFGSFESYLSISKRLFTVTLIPLILYYILESFTRNIIFNNIKYLIKSR